MTDALNWYLSGMNLQAQEKYQEALHAFEQSLSIDPGNPGAWVGKGMAHARFGE